MSLTGSQITDILTRLFVWATNRSCTFLVLCEMNPRVLELMLTHCHFQQKNTFGLNCIWNLKVLLNENIYMACLPWMICFHNRDDSETIFTSNVATSGSHWRFATFVTMMTSLNGNIFRVPGHLCREFIGHRWIPRTKASDAELWCFLWSAPE